MFCRATLILIMTLTLLLSHSVAGTQHTHSRPENTSAALLPGLGRHSHQIATQNPEAQKFFDQGLMMVFGFNRPEAVRLFRRAAELDPQAPMPHWGLALALGRHMNMDLDMDVQEKAAYEAIQKALALSAKTSDHERDYILALAKRCSNDPQADWKKIEMVYKNAMGELMRRYPDDLDAATLYAEALMNLHRY